MQKWVQFTKVSVQYLRYTQMDNGVAYNMHCTDVMDCPT